MTRRLRSSGCRLLLCWAAAGVAVASAADIFSEQHEQLHRFHLGEIRRALAADSPATPQRLGQRLGTAAPTRLSAPPRRVPLAVWPEFRIEEIAVEVEEAGHVAHALVLTPAAAATGSSAVIALGPADRSVEAWAGLTGKTPTPPAWLASLIHRGYVVCLPVTVERTKDHPLSESTRGKDRRHILHRLGFVTGRSVTGLEVTEVRGLVVALGAREVGLLGEGDGAWTAVHAATVEPRRYRSLNLIGYTEPAGESLWREPVDHSIFGQAAMGGVPKPKLPALDLAAGAAPLRAGEPLTAIEVEERRNRHYNGLLDFLRARIRASGEVRRARHPLLITPPAQAVPRLLADLNELMGPVPQPVTRMNARVTELGRTDRFTAHEVRLDVLPGVEAYGHLLVPEGAAGRRLPAVVTQHGLGGQPKDLTLQGPEPNSAYHGYAARLAEHGYVVFAPYVVVPIPQAELINPLARMAHTLGRMRTNVEVAKLRRIVDFLESLPYVDSRRLGYYGLSYGGYSTIWMGPLEPRFQATVISGHFNDWTPKITNEAERTSYLQHPDEDFYNWNVLNRLTHVELIASFWPRAVMVEFAQHDGTTYPAWHERAWAEVEQVARAWGASGRFVRDRFNGIHEIHGLGAFDFLDRWLRPELPSSREFTHWGEVEHTIDSNPLTWVRGEFRVGTRDARFRGLAFRAQGALTVRYGATPGGRELGETTARVRNRWASAEVPERVLDGKRIYHFELRADEPVSVFGPKPLGGSRYPGEFGVAYKPLAAQPAALQ